MSNKHATVNCGANKVTATRWADQRTGVSSTKDLGVVSCGDRMGQGSFAPPDTTPTEPCTSISGEIGLLFQEIGQVAESVDSLAQRIAVASACTPRISAVAPDVVDKGVAENNEGRSDVWVRIAQARRRLELIRQAIDGAALAVEL